MVRAVWSRLRLALAAALCTAVCAALPAGAQPVVEHVTRADGLPSDYVFGLAQDRAGFLWFATDAGVARFDGERFETFTTDDGLPHPLVYAVVVDGEGTVWAATYRGLARFDGTRFAKEATGFDGPVDDAVVDPQGRVVVFGASAARREGPGREGPGHWRTSPPLGFRFTVGGAAALPDGSLLGFAHHIGEAVEARRLRPNTHGGFSVEDVALPFSATLYMPVWSARGASPPTFWQNGTRYAVQVEGGQGDGGRLRFRPLARTPDVSRTPLPYGGALVRFAAAGYRIDGTDGSRLALGEGVQARLVDYEGTTWIGTFGQGVLRVRAAHLTRLTAAPTLRLARDASGTVWATSPRALWRVHPGQTSADSVLGLGTSGRAVAARGTGWAAASTSSLVLMPGGDVQRRAASWVSGLEASTDTLYVSSYGEGLIRVVGGRVRDTLDAGRGLPDNVLEDVVRLPSGLWLLTRSFGALRLRPGDTVEAVGRGAGLPSSSVFALYETSAGVRYVGTDRGIARIAPGRPAEVLGGEALRGQRAVAFFERTATPGVVWAVVGQTLVRLDGPRVQRLSGLALVPHATASVTAALYDPPTDRLFLATSEGLVAADLTAAGGMPLPPPRVALRSVWVDEQPVNGAPVDGQRPGGDRPLALLPGTHRVEIRFALLSFVGGVQGEYRVNGGAWTRTGSARQLVLPQVGHGQYRVEVRAVNAEGLASSVPAVLTLAVPPRLWQRPAFWVLVALALASGAALALRWLGLRRLRARVARLEAERDRTRERARERERLSRDLHDHVGGQLTALVSAADLIGEAARRGDGTRVTAYADAVSVEARSALGQLRQTVTALRQRGLPAADLFRQLQEQARSQLRFAETPALAARFRPATDDDEARLVPADVVFQTMQVAREAVTNTIRHADAGTLRLELGVDARGLRLRVRDDGAGFDPHADRTGSGLDIMHARAADLPGATLRIDSGGEAGTCVDWSVAWDDEAA